MIRFILLFCLFFIHIAGSAQAPAFQRQGFFWGGAVGAGVLHLTGATASEPRQAALSFPNLKFGFMVSERTAVALYLPGTVYRYRGEGRRRERGFEAIVPSVQHWWADRWWALAGGGLGLDAPAFYDIDGAEERKFYFGGAGVVAVGYELWRRKRFALDVQLRAQYNDVTVREGRQRGWGGTVLVGVNLY